MTLPDSSVDRATTPSSATCALFWVQVKQIGSESVKSYPSYIQVGIFLTQILLFYVISVYP